MIRRRWPGLACVAMVCLWSAPARAQDPPTADPPAHIAFVEGSAVLERDGEIDDSPTSMPLLAGDRFRTQGGRVEILFADGSSLHMDANTVVDFQSDEVVRLLDGRMRLSIAGPTRDVAYRVDAPSAWIQISEPGEYRVSLVGGERERQVELAVLRGRAELVNEDGRSALEAGERAFARAGAAPSAPYVYNSAAWDAFDRWSEGRRDQRLGASAQYLPEDVRPYAGTLDAHGSWRYEQVHGYVWYPRVSVGWRPYYHGRWASLRPYGWTWIASDPWGWPTHHYGRWGFSAGAWFWIPGRHWGPAFVSWAYAPGYISWCPLGWNNRPLFSLVNINIFGGRRHYDPWRAWTIIPRHHFDRRFVNVHVNVVTGSRLDRRVWNSFSVARSAPEARFAMPRAAAPIRAAGVRTGVAVPRGSAATGGGSFARDANRDRSETSRGFPAAARAPRNDARPTAERSPNSRTSIGSAGDRAGTRAVPRTPTDARQPAAAATDRSTGFDRPEAGASSGERRIGPQNRRVPSAAPPRSETNRTGSPAATEPPAGLRAVPRRNSAGDQSPSFSRSPAARPRMQSDPSRSGGSDNRPTRSAVPGYRSAPPQGAEPSSRRPAEVRRAPGVDRAPDRMMRSVPRGEMPGRSPAPSYRAPERRGPAGPPPGAANAPSYRAPERRAPSGPGAGASAPSQSSRPPAQARPRGGGDAGGGSQRQAAPRRPRG
jgi:hypothetical protein